MYRFQSSSKRHLINLAYFRSQGEENTVNAVTREAPSEIYLPQYFKLKIKKSFIALR